MADRVDSVRAESDRVENPRAALIEVFHSIQGEGRFVGEGMAFVRVATCPLRCRYCDTPHSYTAGAEFAVRVGGEARAERNPVTGARAAELAAEVARGSPFAPGDGGLVVSITGGEPLVYPGFVLDLARALGPRGRVHLETAALDPAALAAVLPAIAHVSADFKLPETLFEGDPRAENLACVELVARAGRATLDVKIVLTAECRDDHVAAALADLAPHRASLILFLQPVTPFGAVTDRLPPAALARFARRAGAAGFRYRVLPQIHPVLGVE